MISPNFGFLQNNLQGSLRSTLLVLSFYFFIVICCSVFQVPHKLSILGSGRSDGKSDLISLVVSNFFNLMFHSCKYCHLSSKIQPFRRHGKVRCVLFSYLFYLIDKIHFNFSFIFNFYQPPIFTRVYMFHQIKSL